MSELHDQKQMFLKHAPTGHDLASRSSYGGDSRYGADRYGDQGAKYHALPQAASGGVGMAGAQRS